MDKPQKKKPVKLVLKKNIPPLTEENLEAVFSENFEKIDLDDKDYNTYLNNKEILNRSYISTHTNDYSNLYPSLDDPDFNIKIAEKKEFNDTKYDGTIYDIEEQAKKLCEADFELVPHQLFVRNFLSFQTPYNSLYKPKRMLTCCCFSPAKASGVLSSNTLLVVSPSNLFLKIT